MKISVKLIIVIMLLISSCEPQQNNKGATMSGGKSYNRTCIDGVEYLQASAGYAGYMAPHFKRDGSLYLCD